MTDISIITVGMNHLRFLQALLPSLYGEGRPKASFEMIYVDNCSTDGSLEFIRDNYPEVTIIKNREPYGFAENNNRGAFASTGKYLAIVNPDIVLHKGAIDALYDFAENHPQAGILVPQLFNPDGSTQYSVRRFITLKILWGRFLTHGRDATTTSSINYYLCKDLDADKTQTIDWAIGACYFIPRQLYASLSGFDQDYFLYMEDEDLCLRSWQSERPVVYVPAAKMTHNHLRASSRFGKKMFIHMKSMMIFFKKHGINVQSMRNTLETSESTMSGGGGYFVRIPLATAAPNEGRRLVA